MLGFTGTDGQGLEGLELQYDSELRGTAGRLISAKNALGTDMPFEYEQYVEAEDGYNLVLTIDETVQSILEKYLVEGVDQFHVKNGAVAIAMDVDTGAILGMATTPTYDPNDPFTIYDEDLQAQIDAPVSYTHLPPAAAEKDSGLLYFDLHPGDRGNPGKSFDEAF